MSPKIPPEIRSPELVQQALHPNRGSVAALGNQLRRCRCGEGLRHVRAIARATVTLARNPAPMGADFDFDDLGVLRLADLDSRLAARRTCRLVGRQLDLFLDHRQVRVVASPGPGVSG